jgi:hypothetical protein
MNIRNTTRVNECVTGSMAALQAEVMSLRGQIEALSRPSEAKPSPLRSPKRPLTPIGPPSSSFDDKENRAMNSGGVQDRELIQINRELEDMLEEKETLIIAKDREISCLKETVEKCRYELETIREVNEGRFGHAKVLMLTLEELKRENENLIAEVCLVSAPAPISVGRLLETCPQCAPRSGGERLDREGRARPGAGQDRNGK